MDSPLSSAMKDSAFGTGWRPEVARVEAGRPRTGRRSFLGRGAAAAVGAMAVLVGRETRAGNPNYLPSLYPNENVSEFKAIQTHENAHVQYLITAIQDAGGTPRPEPSFVDLTQANLLAFAQTSQALENTGVGAYLGAAPYILGGAYVGAAGSILAIEARHAGYLNVLLDQVMTYNVSKKTPSFEMPLTADEVVALAGPFVTSLNGGPPLTYSTTPSDDNDIAILNFAPCAGVPGGELLQHQRAHFHLRPRAISGRPQRGGRENDVP